MQLIIKTNQKSFLIETLESWTYGKLQLQIAEHLQVDDVNLLSLSFNDQVQLPENDVLLSDLKIQSLDTIYVNLVSEKESSSDDAVEADEINRTIVITKIVSHVQDVTEKAIEETFGSCGAIERMIIQKDGIDVQNAVVIFHDISAASDAVQYDGKIMLGGSISVVAASSLSSSTAADDHSTKIKKLFFSGYSMGIKGASTIKQFDKEHNISTKMKAGAEVAKMKALSINEQFQIGDRLQQGVSTATQKADVLDKKYNIKANVKGAASTATIKAINAKEKAMQNVTVAKGVKNLGGIFSSIKTFSSQTLQEAKDKSSQHESREATISTPR